MFPWYDDALSECYDAPNDLNSNRHTILLSDILAIFL